MKIGQKQSKCFNLQIILYLETKFCIDKVNPIKGKKSFKKINILNDCPLSVMKIFLNMAVFKIDENFFEK